MQTGRHDAFPRECGRRLAALAVLTAGLAIAFRLWPWPDLLISALFHDPAKGFAFAGRVVWDGVLLANKAASVTLVAVGLVMVPVGLWRRRAEGSSAARYWGMVLLLYLIGPGLLVNGLLKHVFGRARPEQIVDFGGQAPFTAAWEISGYCRSACSFVSAEMAAGTALTTALAIGALWFDGRPAAGRFRGLALLSLGLLLLTAVQRIGSGRHFLSDLVFAALLMTMLAFGLACLLWPRTARSCTVQPRLNAP